jgi:hypothetical protein
MTYQKRLNRYISQMEAFRRRHTPARFTRSDDQYAWASIDPDKYGGSPQEDAASA